MSTESVLQKRDWLLLGVLALAAMAFITVAAVPSLRNGIKNSLNSDRREVLAKVSGKLNPQGPFLTILKIRTGMSLSLEIFETDAQGGLSPLTKIPLYESKDGHFLLQENATNLALTDTDGDGNLEIVAPTYDDQMVPRLNVFRFHPETKSFDRVTSSSDRQ